MTNSSTSNSLHGSTDTPLGLFQEVYFLVNILPEINAACMTKGVELALLLSLHQEPGQLFQRLRPLPKRVERVTS